MKNGSRKGAVNPESLCTIVAFRDLNLEQRRQIAGRCRSQRYNAGQHVLFSQDRGGEVFFIFSGEVQVTVFSASGKQVILQDLGPGEMFGELSAIDGEPRSAHVVAATDAWLCLMSAAVFLDLLQRHPPIMMATLKRLTGMVRQLGERVFEVSTLPVKQRLHAELLRLATANARGGGAEIRSPPTHAELANHIGAQREGVSRELSRLRSRGLICGGRNALIVPDVARLRELVRSAGER